MPTWTSAAKPAPMCLIMAQTIFYSEITSGSEQYAFFSVPYDKAWSATVNGESAEILNINGLMAVKVNAGKNCIRFHYSPTPLWCGIRGQRH